MVFLRILQVSSFLKNLHSKFQFDQDRGPAGKPARDDVAFSPKYCYFYSHAKGKVVLETILSARELKAVVFFSLCYSTIERTHSETKVVRMKVKLETMPPEKADEPLSNNLTV